MSEAGSAPGRVWLVGGGPGREDLLTVAAVDALAQADVVLYDRLAPSRNLRSLAPTATLIDVGKNPGFHPIGQDEIESLIIAHARAGARVVRLKGGDPYVLGRGSEEVLACHAAGIPVTVIPGVSSISAVPASVGIPLTHRNLSHLFTVVSGHAPLSDTELRHLAGLGGTIVVLMGIGTLAPLTTGLIAHGLSANTPVAIIENGFQPAQRSTIASLGTIVARSAIVGVRSPAVIVIGDVVRLAYDGDADAETLIARAATLAGG